MPHKEVGPKEQAQRDLLAKKRVAANKKLIDVASKAESAASRVKAKAISRVNRIKAKKIGGRGR